MLKLAAVLSLGLLMLGAVAAVAHLAHRRLPWGLTVFRVLLGATALVWASEIIRLWDLPAFAARQGAGTGAAWPAQGAAVAGAAIIGVLLYIAAWRLALRTPPAAGVIPALVAVVVLLARHASTYGAPEEFYLVDDWRLWVAYALLSVGAAVGLVVYGTHAPRISADGSAPASDGQSLLRG